MPTKISPATATALRARAESKLRAMKRQPRARGAATHLLRPLHELQVHQVELEMQNAEMRRTRDELEIALENYTDLYDFAPVGYFTLAATGIIKQVNLTGASLVGIERSRLVGQPFGLLIAGPLRAAFNAFLKKVFASPAKQSGDFELVIKGPRSRTVNIEALRLTTGQECRVAVVDVTARKSAEEKMRVSEIRYRRLFEAAHDGVLLLDPETCKITDANPFMTKLLGYSHEALVGKELFEIGLLKDETASQEMFQKLKRQHEVRYEDLPLESRRGRHQEVEVVANLYQEDGHAVIQCNIRDITARKQVEEMLRRNEALFSALVEQAPMGVYVVDAAFRLQQVNPTAQAIFKKVSPLIGRDFSEVVNFLWPNRTASQVVARFRRTLKTGRPYHSPDFTERRKDTGEEEVYEWQIQRVTLPAGEHGVVCFFSNITARVKAEAAQRRLDVLTASNQKLEREIVRRRTVELALKKSQRQQSLLLMESQHMQERLRHLARQVLRAQEDERRQISRELHDEIAQTLAGINVYLAALKLDAPLRNSELGRNIVRTQRLVEKSIGSVHRFARELRPTMLDDLGLIPALQAYLKEFTTRTKIRVQFAAFAGTEKLGSRHRTVLYRVAQSALTNIAQHAQATQVQVRLEKFQTTIHLTIHDNGKSFHVARVLSAKRYKRLGVLGMRERVEMVGGQFSITSTPRQGTTVQAQIPFGKSAGGGRKNR